MNASSNASVGELRKHPCGALGAGKQQRLAAGGSRGAHVARLASAGARGRSMAKNAQTSSLPKGEPILVASGIGYRLFSRKMPFLCPHPDGPRGPQHAFLRLSVRLQ